MLSLLGFVFAKSIGSVSDFCMSAAECIVFEPFYLNSCISVISVRFAGTG